MAAHSFFPELDPNCSGEKERNQDGARRSPDTPKREGETLPGPEFQRVKTEGNTGKERNYRTFCEEHCAGAPDADIAVTFAEEDFAQAGRDPTRRWPAFSALVPIGRPDDIVRGPIFAAGNFRSLDPDHGWAHGAALEPLTAALNVAGASCAESHE